MQKKYWVIMALILFFLLSLEVYEYIKVTRENEEASAVTVGIPNPGHAWSTMECSSNTLCLDNTNGYVGIGTNTPAAKLDVNGGVRVGNQTTCNSSLAGTMRYTSANGLQVCNSSGSWLTFYMAPLSTICPSGATCSIDGSDFVIQWTTVGDYYWTVPSGVSSVQYLVVGGGGSGGAGVGYGSSGGGGAGGYLTGTTTVSGLGTISIEVGAGGAAVTPLATSGVSYLNGNSGGDSKFGSIIARGGGYGGGGNSNIGFGSGNSGGSGGSGGGAGGYRGSYSPGSAGQGTSGQGFNGGAAADSCAGGGGGAGGPGQMGTVNNPGQGGPGVSNSITGTAVVYAIGGGNQIPALPNIGMGSGAQNAGAGGSGIVIVRYPIS